MKENRRLMLTVSGVWLLVAFLVICGLPAAVLCAQHLFICPPPSTPTLNPVIISLTPITLTPATLTLTPLTATLTPITLTPATLTPTPLTATLTPITLTPATLTLTPLTTTLTPITLTPATLTPTPLTATPSTPMTITLTLTLTTLTPNPVVDNAAVMMAQTLAPQFSEQFGIQIAPSRARGLDTAWIGGEASQLAGMIAPVIDENQKYTDQGNLVREVEGIFSLNDSRLTLETVVVINKGTIQYPLLPLGAYMLACDTDRPNDCLAVSLQGEEFQINPAPESVSVTAIDEVSPPTVDYEEGSIRKCFKVRGHKICIRVFR